LGPMPTPWESILAASGEAVSVSSYTPWAKEPQKKGDVILNPHKESLFREGFECPWKIAGVWTDKGGEKQLLKKDHFALYNGKPANFTDDFLKPFLIKFINRMKEADRPAVFFLEGIAQGAHPSWSASDGEETVNAFHYYDGLTVFTKRFLPVISLDQEKGKFLLGRKKAAAYYASKLGEARKWTREKMGNIPCLIGEFGLPFDLNNRKAFKTGNYSAQEEALSRYYDAIDKELLHSTIWNYTADNTNEEGDHWNAEDFSIVCKGEGRAMKGWLRPYPMATAGLPLEIQWDRKKCIFKYRFLADPAIKAPTEIFIPSMWLSDDPLVTIMEPEKNSELKTEYNCEDQRLYIYNEDYRGEIYIRLDRVR